MCKAARRLHLSNLRKKLAAAAGKALPIRTVRGQAGGSEALATWRGQLLARYLVRPIRLLQGASRALAAGELDTRVAGVMKGRRDELGQLGQDFDHMAELLDALIEEILLLVRMSGDPREAPRERVELGGLLEELVADANFEQGRVTLEAAQPLHCAVNRRQLHRALENGVRNALKYSTEPITVRLGRQQDRAVVQVLDRGPGLPEAMLGRIFDPFVRADAAREGGCWGLGLAIAAQAVRQHGGTIGARNRDRGGLCLRIELPA